jgi:hypothetical protein
MCSKENISRLALVLALSLWVGALLACNLSNRATSPDGMFDGAAMTRAGGALKQKLGGPFKVLNVEIKHDSVKLHVQDPKQPANVDEYQYWATSHSLSGPRPVELSSLDNNLDNTLFDFDSVNWEATESLARAAIERTQIDGGKIDKILVERNLAIGDTVTKSGHVQWTIDVSNPREHATAYADPQGKIVRLDLSHTSRAAKFTLFSAEALREAVSQIDAFCGGHAKVMNIEISDKWLKFKAPDPKTGEISHYTYDINGVTSDVILNVSGPDINVKRLLQNHKLEEVLFDLDAIKLEQAPEIGQRAVQRLGPDSSLPSNIRVKREELGESTKLTTYWQVDCRMGRKWGTVNYDVEGKELGVTIE